MYSEGVSGSHSRILCLSSIFVRNTENNILRIVIRAILKVCVSVTEFIYIQKQAQPFLWYLLQASKTATNTWKLKLVVSKTHLRKQSRSLKKSFSPNPNKKGPRSLREEESFVYGRNIELNPYQRRKTEWITIHDPYTQAKPVEVNARDLSKRKRERGRDRLSQRRTLSRVWDRESKSARAEVKVEKHFGNVETSVIYPCRYYFNLFCNIIHEPHLVSTTILSKAKKK